MDYRCRARQTAGRDRPRAAHRGCARHRSHRGQTDKRHEFGATRHSRFDNRRGPEEAQMKNRELIAILDRREMGRFFRDMKGHVSFVYDEKWRNAANAYPLSLSMPLTLGEHGNSKTDPFLWGLLPDNEKVLDQWGKKFQVSSRNAFGLIAGVGEDCAGAVQFVRPDRLDAILGKQPPEIEWLTPGEIAQRLRSLREDHTAWRNPRDTGQFSLAGAQPKTALLLEEGQWGIPSGRAPTTHILKPPTAHFDGHAENEHFCLELGRAIGLPVANSEVMRFKDEIAIVIERYDHLLAMITGQGPDKCGYRKPAYGDRVASQGNSLGVNSASATDPQNSYRLKPEMLG